MGQLTGRIALVTGGSRGIGRGIAERLARDGAQVIVHYGSNEAAAKETVAAIDAGGGTAFALRAELGVPGDADTVLDGLREHGVDRLDVLVNNAGILIPGEFAETTAADFDRQIAINVKAPFFLIQRLLPLIPDGGRIINISSVLTRIAGSSLTYALSKGAVDVLSHTLAKHLGPRGITVNTVHPGIVPTDINADLLADENYAAQARQRVALGRFGEPADIADAVAFLASHDSRWITGSKIDTTGGTAL
ncbi:SDR family oxidoreductase [Pseudonocardiaceae bacterium YIM PH 21723]|nr:SDR family oxidoreductase [Pseudonocardiaceae bacterium YIM PH 21723]